MSVVLHEVSHGVVADSLGDPTARLAGRLTLNPLKHLDPVGSFLVPGFLLLAGGPVFGWARPVPYNPYNLRAGRWGPALVALAGPLSNLLVAVISNGKKNRYGHPHTETLKRLNDFKIKTLRTDQEGSIGVTSDGDRFVF